MLKRLFIVAVILLFAHNCFAISAGNTSDPKVPYGPGISNLQASGFGPLKVGFDTTMVLDKDLEDTNDITEGEFNGQYYLFRIGYTFADRIEPYVKLGVSNLEAKWRERGLNITAENEESFAMGIGGKVLAFEIPEYRLRLSIDGQYLYTSGDVKKAYVNDPIGNISATEFNITEWQVAGILSIEFPLNYDRHDSAAVHSIIPYLGLAYADSKNEVSFSQGNQNYDLDTAANDNKFLFITGCDITSPENLSLNIEGRWLGETAVSGGFTAKF